MYAVRSNLIWEVIWTKKIQGIKSSAKNKNHSRSFSHLSIVVEMGLERSSESTMKLACLFWQGEDVITQES